MSKHFAGIRPLSAGWEKIEINPQYDLQSNLSCVVPTVKGYIRLEYHTENGQLFINLECPENSEYVLYAPENSVVTVNDAVTNENIIRN